MGEISRKKVPIGDTGVSSGFATNVNGTVKAVLVDWGDTGGSVTLGVAPLADTGEAYAFAVRSTDTGYDVLKADEQATLSGDRVRVDFVGSATAGFVYLYVDKP